MPLYKRLEPYFLVLILAAAVMIGVAAWVPGFWFLILIAPGLFYFVMDAAHRLQSFKWTLLFVLLTAPILAFPLLSFRSVQSLTPTLAQHYILDIIALAYILLLASLAVAALWTPLAFTKKWQWRIFIIPLAWTLFEFIKAKLSFDLQWISAGELLVDFLPWGIFARFGGVLLLSFFVFTINISLYESVKLFLADRRAGTKLFAGTVTFWILLAISGFFYTTYLSRREQGLPETKVRLAVIQPGSAQGRGRTDFYTDIRKRTRQIATQDNLSGADIIVLPGNYLGNTSRENFEKSNATADILGFHTIAPTSVVGFSLIEAGKRYEVNAIASQEKIQYAYKERLFPFTDYMPPFLKKYSGNITRLSSGYTAGQSKAVDLLPKIKGGVLSCSEEFIPGLFTRLQKGGAKIIIVSGSNDDFTSPTAYREVLRTGRLRALENGIWVVQAMKNGISAIIDPLGRVTQSLEKDQKGILLGEVSLKK